MDFLNESFLDEWDNKHSIIKEISRGGQGVLLSTNNSEIVVKLELLDGEPIPLTDNNETKFNRFKMFYDLNDIDITFPLASLKKYSGYTMRLLNDMISFQKSFNLLKETEFSNDWLDQLRESSPIFAEHFTSYIATGGAKKRLIAFLKTSINIAKLHSYGLVYCDISDNNLFISNTDDIENFNITLIDCDNIDFLQNTLKNGYYTKGYASPEVFAGNGCTFASDCYAFMIAFFWAITGTHPFKGKLVEFYDDEDDFALLEIKANSGEFPWILDTQDDSNSLDTKIPHIYLLGDDLIQFCDKFFCYEGRFTPYSRPTIFSIVNAIYHEFNENISCDNCNMDFNYFKYTKCPYCDNILENVIIISSSNGHKQVLNSNNISYIKKSIITDDIISDFSINAFKIAYNNVKKITSITKLASFKHMEINSIDFFGTYETTENIITLDIFDIKSYSIEIRVL